VEVGSSERAPASESAGGRVNLLLARERIAADREPGRLQLPDLVEQARSLFEKVARA
jgi:hypothetical protein